MTIELKSIFGKFRKNSLVLLLVFTFFAWPTIFSFNRPIVFAQSKSSINNRPSLPFKALPSKPSLKMSHSLEKGYVDGEVLIKFKKSKINLTNLAGKTNAALFLKAHKLSSPQKSSKKYDLAKSNLALVKIQDGKTLTKKLDELKGNANIEYAQLNYRYYPFATSNDTYFSNLWALQNTGQTLNGHPGTNDADIDATDEWDFENSAWSDTLVAAIDSGTLPSHPDISGNYAGGWDFVNDDSVPLDAPDLLGGGHGTHVSGTIAATSNNSTGTSGISFKNNVKLLMLTTDYTTAQMVTAINYADAQGAKAINASWGCVYPDRGGYQMVCGSVPGYDYRDSALNSAIEAFSGLFIAAAGNGNGSYPYNIGDNHEDPSQNHAYPCDLSASNIICVAATDQNDSLATFSDYGSTLVDVGAPGENIYSTYPEGSYAFIETLGGLLNGEIPSSFTRDPASPNYWGSYYSWYLLSDYNNYVAFGDYADNSLYSIYSNDIDLTNPSIDQAGLGFYIACDTELNAYHDYVTVSVSDGAWHELGKYDSLSLNDPLYFNYIDFDVTAYKSANFAFKFTWTTDGDSPDGNHVGCGIEYPGVYTYTYANGYTYMDGTSMAAPHVTGLAGLIWSAYPSYSASQVKSIILNSGDRLSSLAGKTTSGKRINVNSALLTAGDTTPPTGTMIINGNDTYVNTGSVTLNLSAYDNLNNGVNAMRFSNNSINWSDWITNSVSASWDVTNSTYGGNTNQGTKIVYVQFIDNNNNVSGTYSDSIFYDTAKPTGRIYTKKRTTRSARVILRMRAKDSLSGIYKMRFSNRTGKKWSNWTTYKTKYKWDITKKKYGGTKKHGKKYVYVQFMDRAGNISTKYRYYVYW